MVPGGRWCAQSVTNRAEPEGRRRSCRLGESGFGESFTSRCETCYWPHQPERGPALRGHSPRVTAPVRIER